MHLLASSESYKALLRLTTQQVCHIFFNTYLKILFLSILNRQWGDLLLAKLKERGGRQVTRIFLCRLAKLDCIDRGCLHLNANYIKLN